MKDAIVSALVGAAAVGAVMWWLKRRKPCCAECAGTTTATAKPAAPSDAANDAALFTVNGASTSGFASSASSDLAVTSGCTSCSGAPVTSPVIAPVMATAEPINPVAPTSYGGGSLLTSLNLATLAFPTGGIQRW